MSLRRCRGPSKSDLLQRESSLQPTNQLLCNNNRTAQWQEIKITVYCLFPDYKDSQAYSQLWPVYVTDLQQTARCIKDFVCVEMLWENNVPGNHTMQGLNGVLRIIQCSLPSTLQKSNQYLVFFCIFKSRHAILDYLKGKSK